MSEKGKLLRKAWDGFTGFFSRHNPVVRNIAVHKDDEVKAAKTVLKDAKKAGKDVDKAEKALVDAKKTAKQKFDDGAQAARDAKIQENKDKVAFKAEKRDFNKKVADTRAAAQEKAKEAKADIKRFKKDERKGKKFALDKDGNPLKNGNKKIPIADAKKQAEADLKNANARRKNARSATISDMDNAAAGSGSKFKSIRMKDKYIDWRTDYLQKAGLAWKTAPVKTFLKTGAKLAGAAYVTSVGVGSAAEGIRSSVMAEGQMNNTKTRIQMNTGYSNDKADEIDKMPNQDPNLDANGNKISANVPPPPPVATPEQTADFAVKNPHLLASVNLDQAKWTAVAQEYKAAPAAVTLTEQQLIGEGGIKYEGNGAKMREAFIKANNLGHLLNDPAALNAKIAELKKTDGTNSWARATELMKTREDTVVTSEAVRVAYVDKTQPSITDPAKQDPATVADNSQPQGLTGQPSSSMIPKSAFEFSNADRQSFLRTPLNPNGAEMGGFGARLTNPVYIPPGGTGQTLQNPPHQPTVPPSTITSDVGNLPPSNPMMKV